MRSKNHPGRKNARRITTAQRLENAIFQENKKEELDSVRIDKLKKELEKLLVKIVSPEVARSSRTKKSRQPDAY